MPAEPSIGNAALMAADEVPAGQEIVESFSLSDAVMVCQSPPECRPPR